MPGVPSASLPSSFRFPQETYAPRRARRFTGAASWGVALVVAATGCAGGDRPASTQDGAAASARVDAGFAADATAVRAVLAAQQAAWNRGDLEGFMAGYWPSEHLVFMTREGSTRGHAETLARYRASYDRPEKFGALAFEDLDVSPLDAETAVVRGGWRLRRAKDEPHGRFVLVLRRFAEGWRVVSDYTTSDPPPAGPPPPAGG